MVHIEKKKKLSSNPKALQGSSCVISPSLDPGICTKGKRRVPRPLGAQRVERSVQERNLIERSAVQQAEVVS